jgi:AcrR family transcriptional regulator
MRCLSCSDRKNPRMSAEPRSHRSPRAEGDEANRRSDIVRAAARLFRDKGFEATTVRDIAAAVGMQSGSPFYHFETKHDILLAVMEQGLRDGLERTERALSTPLPPAERFRALVRTHLGLLHEAGSEFISVMLHDWRSLPEQHRQRLVESKQRYDAIWQQTLDDLHAMGRLDVEPTLARLLVLGAINFTSTWYRSDAPGDGAPSLDRMADETARLFLKEAAPVDPRLAAVRDGLHAVRAELYEE